MAQKKQTLFQWNRTTDPLNVGRHGKRKDSIKDWIQRVQDASEDAIQDVLGGEILRHDSLKEIIPDDEAVYEAQELVDGWMKETSFPNLHQELDYTNENWSSTTGLFLRDTDLDRGYNDDDGTTLSEIRNSYFCEDYNVSHTKDDSAHHFRPLVDINDDDDDDINDALLVQDVLHGMLTKDFSKNIDLGMKPLIKTAKNPVPKMDVRHEQVKLKGERRRKKNIEKKKVILTQEDIAQKARERIVMEERQRIQRETSEEKAILSEMEKIKIELAEEKQKREEEIQRKKMILDAAKLQMQIELKEKREDATRKKKEKEDVRRQLQKQIDEEALHELRMRMKILHKYFSSWYNVVLERRLEMGKAQAISDWKCKIRAWNAWKAYVTCVKSSHQARAIEEAMKEKYRKEQMSIQHNKRTVLRKCFGAWNKYTHYKTEKALLILEHEEKTKKMAMFLEAASKGDFWMKRSFEEDEKKEDVTRGVDKTKEHATCDRKSNTEHVTYNKKSNTEQLTGNRKGNTEQDTCHKKSNTEQLTGNRKSNTEQLTGNRKSNTEQVACNRKSNTEQVACNKKSNTEQVTGTKKSNTELLKNTTSPDQVESLNKLRHSNTTHQKRTSKQFVDSEKKHVHNIPYTENKHNIQVDRTGGERNTGERNTGETNTGGTNTGERNTGGTNTGEMRKQKNHSQGIYNDEEFPGSIQITDGNDRRTCDISNDNNERSRDVNCKILSDRSDVSSHVSSLVSRKPQIRSDKQITKPLHLAMEERHKDRQKRKTAIEEERRKKEEERLEILRSKEAERLMQEQLEKEEKLKQKQEQKKLEILKQKEKELQMQQFRLKNTLAKDHYQKQLLRKYGIEPLTRLLQIGRLNIQISEKYHTSLLLRVCFVEWNDYVKNISSKKREKADKCYQKILLKRTFRSWLKCRFHLQHMNKMAKNFAFHRIRTRAFHAWQDYVTDQRILMWAKESTAEEHDTTRMVTKCLKAWVKYVRLEKEERDCERRKDEFRKKVQSWLPDYKGGGIETTPPPS